MSYEEQNKQDAAYNEGRVAEREHIIKLLESDKGWMALMPFDETEELIAKQLLALVALIKGETE